MRKTEKVGKVKCPTLNQVLGERPTCERCRKPLRAHTWYFRLPGHLDHIPTRDEAQAYMGAHRRSATCDPEYALKDGYDANRAFRVWHVLNYDNQPVTEIHYWRGFYQGCGRGKGRQWPLFCHYSCATSFASLCWDADMRIQRKGEE
jgi:hypothetical protein